MADSSYYYGLYTDYKSKVSFLKKNIDSLNKIRNKITENDDEQRNVNKKIDDLKDDLDNAVRHDNTWSQIASECENYKEKSSECDGNLKSAIESLDAEINSLKAQKSSAESARDQAYSDYEREKDEEYKRWLESLKKIF